MRELSVEELKNVSGGIGGGVGSVGAGAGNLGAGAGAVAGAGCTTAPYTVVNVHGAFLRDYTRHPVICE
jgi:bacteriocin-like protein